MGYTLNLELGEIIFPVLPNESFPVSIGLFVAGRVGFVFGCPLIARIANECKTNQMAVSVNRVGTGADMRHVIIGAGGGLVTAFIVGNYKICIGISGK